MSISKVPESVPAQDEVGEPSVLLEEFGNRCWKLWRMPVSSAGLVTVIAQIIYAISLFELPVVSFHLLWIQGSSSLYELSSSALLNMSGLYMWCLYASCIVILVPVFIKNRKSWLALQLPMLLLLIVVYEVRSKLGEMTAQNDLSGVLTSSSIMQIVHLDIGFYTLCASSLVLAMQGLRKYVVAGRDAAAGLAHRVV